MEVLQVPTAVRPYAGKVVAVTDALRLEHLDEEYANLCRRMVGKPARKRPTPLFRGELGIWASGVVVDARRLPRALQLMARDMRLIPYVPAAPAEDG